MDFFLVYGDALKSYSDLVFRRIAFVFGKHISYKKITNDRIIRVKELLYRVCVVLVFLSAILWISIFMYVIFYYTYMPSVTHVRPVHLQIKSCAENIGVCSFPRAHVQLTSLNRLLMSSQPYRVKLVMEVPESQINTDLGMFMVCAQMRDAENQLVSSSCRSTMLRYRSNLHHAIRTMVYAPLLVSAFHEEIQLINVELFTNFVDDQTHPVTDVYVELQSRFIQVISCELHIEAHVSGLRYVMYYWPKISALIGICSNLFFVSLMFIVNWYHLQDALSDYIKFSSREDQGEETHGHSFQLLVIKYFNMKRFLKVVLILISKFRDDVKDEKTEDVSSQNEKAKLIREDSFQFFKEEFQELEEKEK